MHIFISHSHEDYLITQDLVTMLAARGITCWIDYDGLNPGTPGWDKEIRVAISQAYAVIVICSENARESNFVAIELAIASGLNIPLYPVWIGGSIWSQSAPMSLVLSQYADLRTPNKEPGFDAFVETLLDALGRLQPQTSTELGWPFIECSYQERSIVVNPYGFGTRALFLSEIYTNLLHDSFAPFSYGKEWALELAVSMDSTNYWEEVIRLLYLPAHWAENPFSKVDDAWMSAPPNIWNGRVPRPAPGSYKHSNWSSVEFLEPPWSAINVLDLRETEKWFLASELSIEGTQVAGITGPPETFEAIVRGGHPKVLTFTVPENSSRPKSADTFSSFEMSCQKIEGVLMGSGHYFYILTTRKNFGGLASIIKGAYTLHD